MELQIPSVTTRSGVEIPQLGFGTYKVTENVEEVVASALDLGYRHLDTAQMYGNEDAVGAAWVNSGIPREQLFLTSKLNTPNHSPLRARESFEQSLLDLRTDYLDLFLIHWPVPMHYGGDFGSTWAVLEELLEEGLVRSIGVSNFEKHHLEKLLQTACQVPEVNQIESHPYFSEVALHEFNRQHGMVTEAWSSLSRGLVIGDPVLNEIGRHHGKTDAQVALRWGLQRGDVVFPKALSRARQEQNLQVFDFSLTTEEMSQIDRLNRGEAGRTGTHPDLMDRL